MVRDLLKAINDCGTILEEHELLELAYYYGDAVFIEDADGNVVDTEIRPNFQAVADIYADGFTCE